MATLSQLAQSNRTTNIPAVGAQQVQMANTGNIQPSKQIDKTEGLIRDIGKMSGGIVKSTQQASQYAGNRVGVDNLVTYSAEMDKIATQFNSIENPTSKDMLLKTNEEHRVYTEALTRGSFPDNDIANDAFKSSFTIPATRKLFNEKANNVSRYKQLHKKEVISKFDTDIAVTKGVFDASTVDVWKQELSAVDAPKDYVWNKAVIALNSAFMNKFKDGITSTSVRAYMINGELTQKSLDKMFNDIYNGFATRTDGVFTKDVASMDEGHYDNLKKSFNGWIASVTKMNKPKKGTKQKVDILTPTAFNELSIDSNVEQFSRFENDILKESAQVQLACTVYGDATNACSKLPTLRTTNVKFTALNEKRRILDKTSANFISSGGNTDLLETQSNSNIAMKSYSGGDDVNMPVNVSPSEKNLFVQEKVSRLIRSVIDSDERNDDATIEMATITANLTNASMSGRASKISGELLKGVSSLSALSDANSGGAIVNKLTYAVTYKASTGATGYNGISKETLGIVSKYYTDLQLRQEENPKKYTDSYIAGQMRVMAAATINSNSNFAYLRTDKALKVLGIKHKDDEADVIVDGEFMGYKTGTAIFGDGAVRIAVESLMSDGTVYQDVDTARKAARGQLLILDKTNIPMISTSTVIAKPSTKIDDSILTQNFEDIVKFKLSQNVSIANVDFDDIVDAKNIQIKQYNDKDLGLQTIVEFIVDGVTHRSIIDDGEWLKGITQKEKDIIDKNYISKGLNPLYGSKLKVKPDEIPMGDVI